MDAKSLTQLNPDKKILRSKTDNEEAEVFVLPPDILQKLGIHLGGVQTVPEPHTDVTSPTGFTESAYVRKTDETILETANLMKKSVFLSPTFISTVSNIPEVEIADISDELEETNTLSNVFQEVRSINTKVINLEPENIGPIVLNTNENVSNIMSREEQYDTKTEEAIVHVEISNSEVIPIADLNILSNNTDIKIATNKETFESIENPSLGCSMFDVNFPNSIQETIVEESLAQKQTGDVNMQVINKETLKNTNNAKHSDETYVPATYSSNINEKSLNISPHISEVNSYTKKEHKAPIRINIISEEILDSAKMKELKSLSSPNSAILTPVTIKPVLHGRKINENNCINNVDNSCLKVNEAICLKETESFLEHFHDFCSRTETNKNVQQNQSSSYEPQTLDKDDGNVKINKKKNLQKYIINGCVKTYDSNEYNQIVNKSIDLEGISHVTNCKCDNYLHTCNNEVCNQKTQNTVESGCSPCNEVAVYKRKDNDQHDNVVKIISPDVIMKEIATKPNVSSINSKSCIHGVEKPGGNNNNDLYYSVPKVLKTYERCIKLKQPIRETSNYLELIDVLKIPEFGVENLNTITISNYVQNQQFCICGDFGKLGYYENDSLYEHIHFWNHNISGINSELIYSIYYDVGDFKYDGKLEDKLNDETSFGQLSFNNICWNDCEIDIQEYIRTFDFNNSNLEISKHCDSNKSMTEFEMANCVINCGIVKTDKKNDEKNVDHNIQEAYSEEKDESKNFNETILTKCKYLCITSNEKQKTNKGYGLDTTSNENLGIPSPCEEIDPANSGISPNNNTGRDKQEVVCDKLEIEDSSSLNTLNDIMTKKPENKHEARILESDTGNTKSTTKRTIKCGVCNELLPEVKWKDHISNTHCYIAWKVGHTIDLDDSELLNKLNKKLMSGDNLKCTFCDSKFNDVKSLISHIKACMEFIKLNSESLSIRKFTKCGVCDINIQKSKWINHIAKQHNYMAWNTSESALDLKNQDTVKDHLYKISKKYNGLICSKCRVVYKYVNSYLKHIKKCDGIEDLMENTSISENTCLNASLETSITKERVKKRKKIENHVLPPSQEEVNRNVDKEIETSMEQLNNVIIDIPSTISSMNETHDQKELLKNKSFQIDALSLVGRALKNVDEKTDETKFKEECINNNANSNPCKTMNEEKAKNYEVFIKMESKIKVEKEEVNSISDDNINIITDIRLIDRHTNKTNNSNKHIPIIESKQKSRGLSGALTTRSKKDVGPTILTEKNDKVSQASISPTEKETMESSSVIEDNVKCGVCLHDVTFSSWYEHISKEHNYLAWKDGTPPLDLHDKYEVEQHLRKILKQYGELLCMKCGCKRKYVKPYMHHIKSCEISSNDDRGVNTTMDVNNTSETNTSRYTTFLDESLGEHDINCGVCHQGMKSSDWLNHIQETHNYMAWLKGEKALDINDAEEVQKHLMSICKRIGGLTCAKCGLVRKYIKTFLHHIGSCGNNNTNTDGSDTSSMQNEGDLVQCGVCSEEMEHNKWKHHAMRKHYNVAWIAGDTPIDLMNFYAVDKYLKEYKDKYNKLVCKVCRISRVSCYGFYAHILFCGKTEEETEKFKSLCEICNNKYICIYRHQHMAMHREQVHAKERKLKLAEERENEKELSETLSTETPGRRKAAEKAKNVIAKYKANLNEGNTTCKKCGYEADNEAELTQHNCLKTNDDCSSDSDLSVKLEQYSEDESIDTDVDSNVSDDELRVGKKKKKHGDFNSTAAKVPRLPYSVKHVGSYIKKSYIDFCQLHLTSDVLFHQWRRSEYKVVSDEEKRNYLPPLKESCKIKFINDEWTTYHLFQASASRDNHIAFVGGIIQCMAWAPCRVDDVEDSGNYLAVGCHSDFDCPRYNCDEMPQHANLIQIWDFGNTVASFPKFAFGIAHDYGTVWAIDWCPSGVRDLSIVITEDSESGELNRLGLLAIACSNGSAYILSVPYPAGAIQTEMSVYRMKPVVELRLSMSGNKRKCQATSLSWSTQKGHAIIIVGYSDGMIAFYDLNSDSPFLIKTENNITIVYPYHDERSYNTCVTGVGMFTGGTDVDSEAGPPRAWSTASCSGARACAGVPGRTAIVHTHLASTGATFTPHWPSVQLTGDSYIGSLNQTVNELEWVGGGRRVGGARSWCACARCGLSAAAAPPLIRVLHAHPAYTEIRKQIIGVLEMSPIGQKRKQNNDELAINLEPFYYEDAVKKYGIEFKLIPGKNKAAQHKATLIPSAAYPERYPLADITCMAFCPSPKCHNKLAIGTHAGIILYINV